MPRAQLTDSDLQVMRQYLSAAALDIFRSAGLEAVTFRRIAETTGISHALPYRYFDNKEALLARMRADCTGQFEAFMRARERSDDPPLSRAISLIQGYIDFVRQCPADYLLIFSTEQPSPSLYPELLAARRSLFDHAVDVMQLGIDSGDFSGQAREITHAMWVSVHGLMTLHVANQLVHGYSLEELVHPLLRRVLGSELPGLKPGLTGISSRIKRAAPAGTAPASGTAKAVHRRLRR